MSDHLSQQELSEYLDGEARNPEGIKAHLQRCAECARRHVEMSKLASHLRALPEPDVHPGFATRVMGSVGAADAQPKRRALRYVAPIAAAASLLAAATLLTLTDDGGTPPEAPPVVAKALVLEDEESLLAELADRLAANSEPDSILWAPFTEDVESLGASDEDYLLALSSEDWFDGLAAEWNGEEDLESALTGLDQTETEAFVLLLNEYATQG